MSVKIAAIQLQTLPMSNARLDYYIRRCAKMGVNLITLGEYVLNNFFKELEKIPSSMIKEQSEHRLAILKDLAKSYNVTIIAPIILYKKDKPYKAVARFTPNISFFYEQKILINYKHWDEDRFFANNMKDMSIPLFIHEGLRVGIISGFEAHFDIFWQQVMKKKVDLVLMPSVSTFESRIRWSELLKTRAFLNSAYILRVNRVGSFKDKAHSWYFYGDTALYSPDGTLEASLGDGEEMLIGEININAVIEARKIWGFRNQLVKKELLN
ncbi:MAG: carbon-nitrogen hydrolase family protein [Campylobacteraceae bacterium]|jgi:nitrilase|nr:carbon-nitrogen hydrolase family protein [Campylobacteraceae bacterium]